MIYTSELLQTAEDAFNEGYQAGKISGIDSSYLERAKAKFLNSIRVKLGLPPKDIPITKDGH